MNKRIKQLIEEASGDDWRGDKLNAVLLVELVVRECSGVNYNSSFQDGEFHARELLEHFGIEE
jgi:hypothetical protein